MGFDATDQNRKDFAILSDILGVELPRPTEAGQIEMVLKNACMEAAEKHPTLLIFRAASAYFKDALNWGEYPKVYINRKMDRFNADSHPRDAALIQSVATFMCCPYEDKEGVLHPSRWEGWRPLSGGLVAYAISWARRGLQNELNHGEAAPLVSSVITTKVHPVTGKRINVYHRPKLISHDYLSKNGMELDSSGHYVKPMQKSFEEEGLEGAEICFVQGVESVREKVEVKLDVPRNQAIETDELEVESQEEQPVVEAQPVVKPLPRQERKEEFDLWSLFTASATTPGESILDTSRDQASQDACVEEVVGIRHFGVVRSNQELLVSEKRPDITILGGFAGRMSPDYKIRMFQLKAAAHELAGIVPKQAACLEMVEEGQWLADSLKSWEPAEALLSEHLIASMRIRREKIEAEDYSMSM